MKLLADEGVDKPIVDALRLSGFNVTYILEDNQGADDEFILKMALKQRRLLITQDKDFGEIVFRLRRSGREVNFHKYNIPPAVSVS